MSQRHRTNCHAEVGAFLATRPRDLFFVSPSRRASVIAFVGADSGRPVVAMWRHKVYPPCQAALRSPGDASSRSMFESSLPHHLPTCLVRGRAAVAGFVGSRQIQIPPRYPPHYMTVYNTGSVSLTINGQTVTVPVNVGASPLGVAFALANAIAQNATLHSQCLAVSVGSKLYLKTVNSGTQYQYPWSTSCTYNSQYFSSCGISATLAPSGSLTVP